MKLISKSPSCILLSFCFGCIHLLYLVERSTAQNATTDPTEAAALNSIFRQWGVSALPTWNTTGDPCTGVAVDDSKTIDDQDMNPAIKCDCTFNNRTTCRITALRVYALNARGTIPAALGNLTRLTNLNLGQNYFTGPLPSFIGNLTAMQYLTFGINALSGTIPKELGNLRNIVVLSFSSNSFNGPLPAELGNLATLEQLYIDSAGVSGPIPSTFSNLVNLQTVWASDNAFNGSIPNFIGNWTKLKVLRFQGNAFQGPIPSSFSNLTSLTDLRISDIKNGSTSLAFISNMKNLTTLILRNNRISDTIPSNIGEYRSLMHLDLSFNNLTGVIPSSLFNLTSLRNLFLGNNSLSGSIPSSKSSLLANIDLSYNQLSGSFPSWITQGLQLNLVANNFVIDSSNNSALPSGLNCLQRNFPCNRNSPIYSQFAIKCGGRGMTSNDRTVYENDNEPLGVATYYVTGETRWAVSNAGLFAENNNASYISSSSSQFLNTLDSELFQTARISPGSLRYYGLGLENGQYTITMQFAEIAIEDSTTWRSVGRRVFDIYAQGNLQLEDFDIKRAAGGASKSAVTRTFQANVTENFLEIHLFWAGKGTCCIPAQGTYGPSVSAISVTPDFTPTVSNRPPGSGKKNKTGLIVGIVVGALSFISIFALFIWRRRRRGTDEDEEFLSMAAKANTFSYSELRTATDDFSPANKLGEGGFGPVFKGTLTDGRVIAVKQLSVASHQGKSQFVTEIATISAVQHKNLVKLYGCCIEGEKRLLVYEYLENKSLDQALFGSSNLNLNWATRFEICLGTARGLAYLHEESRLRIVHRDVKASNILLDADLVPKISDFGLAKLYDDKKTHISTRVAGTIGYLAPEYAMRGHLTEKADVFGFGVVALEILSGRMNSDTTLDQDKIYLLEWAWNLHETNRPLELMDQTLSEFDKEEALRMIGVALLCTQASPGLRPPMSRVVAMLAGDIEVNSITSRPGYLTDWQFEEINTFMTDDTSRESTGRTSSQLNTSSNSTTFIHASPSPLATQPMLQEIVGEGR
ncbi:probable LRR receptor-like serine/threonine-protein kinase At1g56140 [Magnolia sinica]|uniref:probable LRR receptor-like serine/threonine-protein kinase At1g56140 n=1 Tax=Magnolia sinica TaxID=86752 RepID=UPI00265AEABF|nr:probable LRR receptor-like serine/threonine-protein kinase At1g56140 [Magnolia sinica]